ncbi:MAG: nitroreductase family protein [Fibrobacter sp.]|nr:nitroreductase family protein [Fibrobacter sp.]
MKFNELVKARYSCRKFDERHVEEEKLRYILEAGRLAPTAKNAQPVTVLVLKSEKSLDKLRALTQMTYNSRLVLVVCYDTSISWKATNYNDNFDSGDMDASIVATHMVLAAKDVGVDSLWARAFNASDVARAFELPENIHVACILDLGYASTVAGGPSPRHEARKQMEQFAREL